MIKLFLKRIVQFLFLPIMITGVMSLLYLKADPFLDFRKDNYSWKYFFQGLGDLATKKLIDSNLKYNSFIFGSSVSANVYACYLQNKIPESIFFHYADWGETVEGVYNKMKFIDSSGYEIKNVFWFIDANRTFMYSGTDRIDNHYLLTGQKKRDYLIYHFKAYYKSIFNFNSYSKDRIKILLGLPVEGEIFPNWNSDLFTNDTNHSCDTVNFENYAKIDSKTELKNKVDSLRNTGKFFHKRDTIQQYNEIQIVEMKKELLLKIYDLFKKHNTNFYIVITPAYDQKKFDPLDYAILNSLFGDRLYDFSGINDFTNNDYNYYDGTHYQKYISKHIIDQIFSENN